jgi:SEC-C motif
VITLPDVQEYLREGADTVVPAEIEEQLVRAKQLARDAGDEATAKEVWFLQTACAARSAYLRGWQELRKCEYYKAWCSLVEAENGLATLSRHVQAPDDAYRLGFMARAISALQKVFPYNWFTSPELVLGRPECTICKAPIRPRHPCGHRNGEIYGGELCSHVLHPEKIVGASLVKNPAMKANVVFLPNDRTGSNDHYDYRFLHDLTEKLRSPFHNWRVAWQPARIPETALPPSAPCPCGSAKAFKECCAGRSVLQALLQTEDRAAPVLVGMVFSKEPSSAREHLSTYANC